MTSRAILLVDHGSRRAASNDQLAAVARMVEALLNDGTRVFGAHMDIAEPGVAAGFAACVAAGATEVIAVPYMLAPGRHAMEDIPRLVAEAAAAHPGVRFRVAEPLGVHPGIGEAILDRAGLRDRNEAGGASE